MSSQLLTIDNPYSMTSYKFQMLNQKCTTAAGENMGHLLRYKIYSNPNYK